MIMVVIIFTQWPDTQLLLHIWIGNRIVGMVAGTGINVEAPEKEIVSGHNGCVDYERCVPFSFWES